MHRMADLSCANAFLEVSDSDTMLDKKVDLKSAWFSYATFYG